MEQINQKALWNLSYGLYIVTSHDEEKLNGQIANTVEQVSAEPPMISVCINKRNLTHEYISKSSSFAVSVLDISVPMTFIGLFGFKSGRDEDKLSQCKYKSGITGSPIVLDYALSTIEAEVVSQLDVGTHTIFVGKVVAAEVLKEGTPLTYADYHIKKKGKAPKSAPTYREPGKEQTIEKGDNKMLSYVCDVCGYVYDSEMGDSEAGIEPGTSFEDLPDDWACPVCGADKTQFSPVE